MVNLQSFLSSGEIDGIETLLTSDGKAVVQFRSGGVLRSALTFDVEGLVWLRVALSDATQKLLSLGEETRDEMLAMEGANVPLG